MMSSLDTSSPVSASTLAYLMRWPVFLLIWLKLTFSLSEVAGNRATGQVTSDSRRKPFQFARGAILELHYTGQRLNRSASLGFQKVQQKSVPPGAVAPARRQARSKGGARLFRRQACQRFRAGYPQRLL